MFSDWGSTGWGHGGTLCAQAGGQRIPRGGGHTHTAQDTAPGGGNPARLARPSAWYPQGKSDRAARGNAVLAQAALGHGRRYSWSLTCGVMLELLNLGL